VNPTITSDFFVVARDGFVLKRMCGVIVPPYERERERSDAELSA